MPYTELSIIGVPGKRHIFVAKTVVVADLTIRQQFVTAVKTRFQSILIAGGYNFNLGSNVFEWRSTPLESVNLPALVFRDVSESTDSEESKDYHTNGLLFEVDVIAEEGLTTADDLRKMISDVYEAIGVDPTWSGLAVTTEAAEDATQIEQQENIVGEATIQFLIVYGSPAWDSYTAL